MDDVNKLETSDIANELEKLSRSGVLKERTTDACEQAAWLVRKLHEFFVPAYPSPESALEAWAVFHSILMRHHEG